MLPAIDRRRLLFGTGAAGLAASVRGWPAAAQLALPADAVSVEEFGARSGSGQDDTRAIQAAIHGVERRGGGTVLVPGRYHCGNIAISGENVRIQGRSGWLIDGRLTIRPEASGIEVADLGLLVTRNGRHTWLMDVAGRNCRFTNVELVKDPVAGGYQMYMRQPAAGCRFDRLRLRGSNGIMVAGRDHVFENFDFESKELNGAGGDDAFAIKGLEDTTENIVIRNGIVRGYAAIVSLGSEIGTLHGSGPRGIVRNVVVENVTGDRCSRVAFLKPGALRADYRDGLLEGVRLRNLSLSDPRGEYFRSGIQIYAGRGATIRDVQARDIHIRARAKSRGVAPTSAIDIDLIDVGAPARIEDVDLQVAFVDPYSGVPHSKNAPGYPIGHVVRIERYHGAAGSMSGITLDIEGRGAAFGGIWIGPGLDDAVRVERAVLERVATDPPSSRGGGGIWSNSRVSLGDVKIDSVKLPDYGGTAFAGRHQ